MMASMVVMLAGLLTIAVPIALITWLVVSISKKGSVKKEETSAEFEKGIRLFYMYAVMIVMLFTAIGCSISAITAIGEILFPDVAAKYALKTLVVALVGIAISTPVFVYHFRQTKEQ